MVQSARHMMWAAVRVQGSASSETGPIAQFIARAPELGRLLSPSSGTSRTKKLVDSIESISISVAGTGGSVKRRSRSEEDSGSLNYDQLVRLLGSAARNNKRGLLVAVDELQACSRSELEAFGRTMQDANSEQLPVVYLFAGLPNSRAIATAAAAITFTERVAWEPLEFLNRTDTHTALQHPLTQSGRAFSPAALDMLWDLTNGYPFLIQNAGKLALDQAGDNDLITPAHVTASIPKLSEDLDNGVYGATWDRLPHNEQRFLYALAACETETPGPLVPSGAVYARLGLKAEQASTTRARLIDRGVIYAEHRTMGFTLPAYGNYILNRKAEHNQTITTNIPPPNQTPPPSLPFDPN